MALDLAGRHPARVERQDLVVEAVEAAGVLGHDPRLETRVAVAWQLDRDRPVDRPQRLTARAVTTIVLLLGRLAARPIPEMLTQLSARSALDQPLPQLIDQAIRAGQITGVLVPREQLIDQLVGKLLHDHMISSPAPTRQTRSTSAYSASLTSPPDRAQNSCGTQKTRTPRSGWRRSTTATTAPRPGITRTSDALRKLPALDEAMGRGELTLDQVAAAAGVATPETDAELARIAVGKAPGEIARAPRASSCRRVVADDQALYERRALSMTWTGDGRELTFSGSLPLEQGVAFEQAIWTSPNRCAPPTRRAAAPCSSGASTPPMRSSHSPPSPAAPTAAYGAARRR